MEKKKIKKIKCEFPDCAKKLNPSEKITNICGPTNGCQKNFCNEHLPPEFHNCAHDFTVAHKKMIQENNPEVKADKVQQI